MMRLIDIIKKSVNDIVVLSPTAIGEALIVSLLLDQCRIKYGKDCHLVLPSHQLDIVKLIERPTFSVYEGNHYLMRELRGHYNVLRPLENKNLVCIWPEADYCNAYNNFNIFLKTEGVYGTNYVDTHKYILGLDYSVELSQTNNKLVESSKDFLIRIGLKSSNYIIMNVGSNSRFPLPDFLVQSIIDYYNNAGLCVIVNRANSLFQVGPLKAKNLVEVNLSIYDASLLSLGAKAVFTTMSGFSSCLAFIQKCSYADTKLHVLGSDMQCIDYSPPYKARKLSPFECNKNCTPSLISFPSNFYEWYIPTNLEKQEYTKMVHDIITENTNSEYYIK